MPELMPFVAVRPSFCSWRRSICFLLGVTAVAGDRLRDKRPVNTWSPKLIALTRLNVEIKYLGRHRTL